MRTFSLHRFEMFFSYWTELRSRDSFTDSNIFLSFNFTNRKFYSNWCIRINALLTDHCRELVQARRGSNTRIPSVIERPVGSDLVRTSSPVATGVHGTVAQIDALSGIAAGLFADELFTAAVTQGQTPERQSEVRTVESVYKRIYSWIHPACNKAWL